MGLLGPLAGALIEDAVRQVPRPSTCHRPPLRGRFACSMPRGLPWSAGEGAPDGVGSPAGSPGSIRGQGSGLFLSVSSARFRFAALFAARVAAACARRSSSASEGSGFGFRSFLRTRCMATSQRVRAPCLPELEIHFPRSPRENAKCVLRPGQGLAPCQLVLTRLSAYADAPRLLRRDRGSGSEVVARPRSAMVGGSWAREHDGRNDRSGCPLVRRRWCRPRKLLRWLLAGRLLPLLLDPSSRWRPSMSSGTWPPR